MGGDFVQAGGLYVNNIASWNGTVWDTLGAGADGTIYALTAYNGLFAGGSYTEVGIISPAHGFTTSIMTNAIAEWKAPVGINEITENKYVKIYPNPNNGSFYISMDNLNGVAQLKLYNVYGEEIQSSELNSGTSNINIEGKASGLYLYRILNEEGVVLSTGNISLEK